MYAKYTKEAQIQELDPVLQWQNSDLIPRLLEIFEKWKTFMVILLSVKNDAYSRILGA